MVDSTTGVTISSNSQNPYATIQEALDAAVANDTATVGAAYVGNLTGTVTSTGLTFSAPASVAGIQLALSPNIGVFNLAGDAAIQVTGTSGNDTISGNVGADTLIGGLGNDVYIVNSASTIVVEASGNVNGSTSSEFGGRDEIRTGLPVFSLTQFNNGGPGSGANVEILRGTSSAGQNLSAVFNRTYPVVDSIIGGDGNDTITTSTQDQVLIDGGRGDDRLSAASGDTIIGGAGHDTIDLSSTGAIGINVDAVTGETIAGGEGDLIIGSNYNGSLGGDYITAGGHDTVFGNAGDDGISVDVNSLPDLINGGANGSGGDRITFSGNLPGGARATPLAGSITNAEYLVINNGSAGNRYDFSNLTQGVAVTLVYGGVGQGIYPIDVIGTSGNDTISPSGNADTLAGGAGTDVFFGGVDDLIGARITDIASGETIRFRQGSGSPNVINSNFTASLSGTTLTYDPDGAGPEAAQTLTLANGVGGTVATTFNFNGNANSSYATVTFTAGNAPPPVGGGGGGGGSSTSTSSTDGPDLLNGTSGDDTLVGMDGVDTLNGGDGNDVIFGNQQGDSIDAGSGNNTAFGGMGDDSISAGAGNDLIFGNEGADTIVAGDGDNTVVGGQDSADAGDKIVTGSGNDLIFGNGGNDSISAGAGNDSVVGGFGDDILFGNQGDDIILGNEGNDVVFGGFGNDTLVGGIGDDTLYGNEGDDVIYGNEGADRLIFGAGSGNDIVNGFSSDEGDRLDLQGQTYALSQDTNGYAVLTLSGGGVITLSGVAANQVGAGFFA